MQYLFTEVPSPKQIFGGAIFYWENVFPTWKDMIEGAEKEVASSDSNAYFTAATTFDGSWEGRRRNQILPLTDIAIKGNPFFRTMHNHIAITLNNYLQYYSKYFETAFGEHEPYGLLKYSGTTLDHYDAHYDGGPSTGRWISAVMYLNDDYEGGEIEFVDHMTKIKPKAGSLVLFPSNYAYRHIAHAVTSGTKYAIVTWINGQ